MMPVEAGGDPAAGPGCEQLRDRMDPLISQAAAILDGLERDPLRQDMAGRLSRDVAAWREARSWLDSHVLADEMLAAAVARAEQRGFDRGLAAARVPGQRKGRHASASLPQRALRVVTGIAGALGLTGALRHLLAASPAVKVAAGGAAVLTAAVTLTPSSVVTLPWTASTGQAPLASVSASASPMPRSSLIAEALSRPEAKARSARRVPGVLVPPSVPPASPSAVVPPSASPSPSSQSRPGVLAADTGELNFPDSNGDYNGTVNLSAAGAAVTWHAVCGDPDVVLTASQGTVYPDGQPYALTVSIDAAAQAVGGSATITLWPGEIRVTITWQALVAPSPADSPSPDPTSS